MITMFLLIIFDTNSLQGQISMHKSLSLCVILDTDIWVKIFQCQIILFFFNLTQVQRIWVCQLIAMSYKKNKTSGFHDGNTRINKLWHILSFNGKCGYSKLCLNPWPLDYFYNMIFFLSFLSNVQIMQIQCIFSI